MSNRFRAKYSRRKRSKKSEITNAVLGTTQSNFNIYLNPEREDGGEEITLNGVRGNISIQPAGATSGPISIVLHRLPLNVAQPVLSVTNSAPIVEAGRSEYVIWSQHLEVDSDIDTSIELELDIKAKRILKPGYILYLSGLSSTANVANLAGQIIPFFLQS